MDKDINKIKTVKREYLEAANAFSKAFLELGLPLDQLILFGSRIKGSETKYSDLDLCVVSPVFGTNRQAERVLLMRLKKGVSDLIEPHPYSPKDLGNKYDPLASQILKTGIRVY
ncbi:MAG: nucleotidyltransferase domain-containing protein [Patescibacteria group bacterium]